MQGGIPIFEAAQALGISERTVRRRIKDGDLNAYEIHTANGMAWRVVLPLVQGRQWDSSIEAEFVSTALATVDKRLDRRDQVIGAFLMEMAQRIEALEAAQPMSLPPMFPDGLPLEEKPFRVESPSQAESSPEGSVPTSEDLAPGQTFWERIKAIFGGGQ